MFNIASRLFCTMFTNLLAFIIWLFQLVVCCHLSRQCFHRLTADIRAIISRIVHDILTVHVFSELQIVLAFHWYHYPKHVTDGADKKKTCKK